ncbi:MAG: TolC family protein [Gemmatimonadales bacterium]
MATSGSSVMGIAMLVLGCAAVAQAQGTQPVPRLTLAEAIGRANRVQPSVVQAFGSVRSAQARERASLGSFLPSLTVGGSFSNSYSGVASRIDPATQQVINSSTSQSLGTSLSSNVEIFTGFRRGNERKAAKANRAAADASLESARFNQQLTTTNAFFDVLAAEQLLRVREASVRRAEEQLKVSVALLHAGRGIRPDSLRSLVTLGNARLALLTSQTDLAVAQANLGRLVGEDGPVGAEDDSTLYTILPALDANAIRTEALAQAPSVRSSEASATAAHASVGVAKASYFPTLNLSGSISFSGSRANDYDFFQQRNLNVGLSWPLFNRFQREQSIANALSSAETADANAAEARRQVLADVTAALASLEAARLRIEITQTSVEAAREDLRVQQERYRLGASTIVDVLTSQEALNQAEVDAVNARFDYVRARAELSALLGRPL